VGIDSGMGSDMMGVEYPELTEGGGLFGESDAITQCDAT
jgi:hypothetical protein